MITQSDLKELLHYDKDTGVFTWLVARSRSVNIGQIAGSIRSEKNLKAYCKIRINNKAYYAHRLAWLYVFGKFPDDQIDHISGDGTDNRIVNLRSVSPSENSKNIRKSRNNSSGITGVSWCDIRLSWRAVIGINNKIKHVGYFQCVDAAIKARKSAEIKYGFHKNHGTSRPL